MNEIVCKNSVAGQISDKANLEVSEARYRRLFEAAQDGILILAADTGLINDANPFLMKMIGYCKKDILGKNFGKSAPLKTPISLKKQNIPSTMIVLSSHSTFWN